MAATFFRLAWAAPLLLGAALGAGAAVAQTPGEIVPAPNPDADALAARVRVLASEPDNLEALLGAGELALKLGDPTAAAAFFQRAERVSPNNGPALAGRAATLVHVERPGEALRYFARAADLGVDPARFAAERGLAYDLLGEQERAQRDYRLALRAGPDDELLRRYALSLGISGKREPALAVIEPLVRRQDRAAWRIRAFILALAGDAAGAEAIAVSMLPGQMASGLLPFFQRLVQLGPADRAFAVHFGELTPTPERIADARTAPPLPRLEPEPAPLVAAAAPPPRAPERETRRDRRRDRRSPVIAAAPPPPPMPPPPVLAEAGPPVVAQTPSPPARVAAPATGQPLPPAVAATRPAPSAAVASAPSRPVVAPPSPPLPSPLRESRPSAPTPAVAAPAAVDPVGPPSRPGPVFAPPAAVVQAVPVEPTPPPAQQSTATPVREDGSLARIMADIARDQPKPASAPAPERTRVVEAAAAPAEPARPRAAPPKPEPKKEKPAKPKPDPAKTDPPRIWVQVAGGASEAGLARTWAAVKAKAPAAFKGRQGYTTPLRFTNRVLAGPFKTDDEAQAFINQIAKSGISGFVFKSEPGQKVEKLADK